MEPPTCNLHPGIPLTSHPKPAEIIEKRLPAPTPQGRADQIWRGTRAEWRREGGGGRDEEKGWGLVVIIWFTAKGAKTAKDPTAMAFRPLRCSIS